MRQMLAKLGVAVVVAATALSGTADFASAQGVDIYVGPGRHRPPPPDYDRPPPRRVIVDGFGRRGPDTMMFANVRGCPLLGR